MAHRGMSLFLGVRQSATPPCPSECHDGAVYVRQRLGSCGCNFRGNGARDVRLFVHILHLSLCGSDLFCGNDASVAAWA